MGISPICDLPLHSTAPPLVHGGRRVRMTLVVFRLLVASLFLEPFFSTFALPYEEVLALKSFKQEIYEDPLAVMADWSASSGDPCNWTGVHCSGDGSHVISLKLHNSSLRGFLAQEIGLLSALEELVLSKNLFLGAIPKQIGLLKNLSSLDLSNNRFCGPIPLEIGNLASIRKINFHYNGLTGGLPPEFGKLTNLEELRLDRNRLHGPIPGIHGAFVTGKNNGKFGAEKDSSGLCLLDHLEIGDFSYNFLSGEVPKCLDYLPSSSFQGNCLHSKKSILQRSPKLCGGSGSALNPKPNRHAKMFWSTQKSRQPKWLMILEIVTGIIFIILLLVAVTSLLIKYKKKSSRARRKRELYSREQMILSIDGEMLKHVRRIDRKGLEVACEDFSNIIGTSSDSIVYKGTMKDGPEIAVIALCISEDNWTSDLELYFQTEVANLARINHANATRLLGYCKEADPFSRMLVFDYASNGTLYEHLHIVDGEECQLSWSRRMKIAIGVARGLRYLHMELLPPVSLSELHSATVYLTEDFSPKLVDFESWRAILLKSEKNSGCIISGGPFHGLQDLLERRQPDIRGNIFAFGVLLLEIVSGRPPYCKDRGCLVDWALEYLEKPGMMCHLVDPELRYFNHDDLKAICDVVRLCLSEPARRPTMDALASMLESGIDTSVTASLRESQLAWVEMALAT